MGVCLSCNGNIYDDEITTDDIIMTEYDSVWSEDMDSEDTCREDKSKLSFETF